MRDIWLKWELIAPSDIVTTCTEIPLLPTGLVDWTELLSWARSEDWYWIDSVGLLKTGFIDSKRGDK